MRFARWALAALLLATAARAQPAAQKVLRVVPSADLTQLDPGFASIVITSIYGLMVYETLFAWDSKLQPKPQMVKDWSASADGLVWQFSLRPSLTFHDGQRVTTADVLPSLQRWMARDVVGQKLAASVTGMDAINPDTFEIRLSKPYPAMLFSLGSGIGQVPIIMRAQDLNGDPAKPITTAIGSGPFRFNKELRVSGASAESCARMLARVEGQQNDRRIARHLPRLDRPRWGSKTGSLAGVANDVGFVVTDSGPLIMAVFCEDLQDPNEGERVIGDIAGALLGIRS